MKTFKLTVELYINFILTFQLYYILKDLNKILYVSHVFFIIDI